VGGTVLIATGSMWGTALVVGGLGLGVLGLGLSAIGYLECVIGTTQAIQAPIDALVNATEAIRSKHTSVPKN